MTGCLRRYSRLCTEDGSESEWNSHVSGLNSDISIYSKLSIRLRMGSGSGHKPSPTTVEGMAAGISAADTLGMAGMADVGGAVLSGMGLSQAL